MVADADLQVRAEFLLPNSSAELWFFGEPVRLGSYTSDEEGTLETVITIPLDTPVGQHFVELRGFNEAGAEIRLRASVDVLAANEGDLVLLLVLAVLALAAVGSLGFLAYSYNQRRRVKRGY